MSSFWGPLQTGQHSGSGAGISAGGSIIQNNVIRNNQSSNWAWGGGVYLGGGNLNTEQKFLNNTVVGNNSSLWGGGILCDDSSGGRHIISGNYIAQNTSDGGGGVAILSKYGFCSFTNNIVINNKSNNNGSGVFCWDCINNFSHNTIVNNISVNTTAINGGLFIRGGDNINYNNLYGNIPYDVVVENGGDIHGENNYWGTVETINIMNQIYDWYDDTARGRFLFIPYLQDPDPDSPIPPPSNLQINVTDSLVQLRWSPIKSTTMGYGYKIYYDNDFSGPPYNGIGLDQGNSPIDVGNNTIFALSGFGNGAYYIAVTAYDTLGHESWYSYEVDNLPHLYLPFIKR